MSGSNLVAVTNVPSPLLYLGVRTFADEAAVDYAIALRQHEQYRDALRQCGCRVVSLEVNREHPDSVFIEDTALVLDEVAIMMSPGAASRRDEPRAIELTLRDYREVVRVEPPGTIDGGDIVRSGHRLYVGESQRTNLAGISALAALSRKYGYEVASIPVFGCLHLKSACSALPDGRFLVNADWIDVSPLPRDRLLQIPDSEAWAGDVLVVGERVIVSDAFPETIELLEREGWEVVPVGVSEFAKVEGGVTCLSLVFDEHARA
jgi:dimethylargininase